MQPAKLGPTTVALSSCTRGLPANATAAFGGCSEAIAAGRYKALALSSLRSLVCLRFHPAACNSRLAERQAASVGSHAWLVSCGGGVRRGGPETDAAVHPCPCCSGSPRGGIGLRRYREASKRRGMREPERTYSRTPSAQQPKAGLSPDATSHVAARDGRDDRVTRKALARKVATLGLCLSSPKG